MLRERSNKGVFYNSESIFWRSWEKVLHLREVVLRNVRMIGNLLEYWLSNQHFSTNLCPLGDHRKNALVFWLTLSEQRKHYVGVQNQRSTSK